MKRIGLAAVVGVILALGLWFLIPPPQAEVDVDPRVAPLLRAVEQPMPEVEPSDDGPSSMPIVWREVSCPLPVKVTGRKDDQRVLMFAANSSEVMSVAGDVNSHALRFSAPTADGAGLVELYGHQQAPVIWWTEDDGVVACIFSRDPEAKEMVAIRVSTLLAEGTNNREIYAHVCGMSLYRALQEGPVEIEAEPGPCEVRACRFRMAATFCNETISLDLELGSPVDLELEFPDFAPAGLALTLAREEEALVIRTVPSDSPSEQAGIELGDRILAINGETVTALEGEWHRFLIGPEGSPLFLEMESADGEPFEVELERHFVEER